MWWERHKLIHEEIVEDAFQINMGIHALTTNYAIASSPKATMKRGGWVRPPVVFVKLNVDVYFDQDFLRARRGRS